MKPRPEEPVAAEPVSELDQLREEVAFLKSCGIIELAVRNPNVADYMKHWEGRAEKAEAALIEVDRLGLIIEAGVRWSDPQNSPQIELLFRMPALREAAARRREAIQAIRSRP